jgi:hypothetical protein
MRYFSLEKRSDINPCEDWDTGKTSSKVQSFKLGAVTFNVLGNVWLAKCSGITSWAVDHFSCQPEIDIMA